MTKYKGPYINRNKFCRVTIKLIVCKYYPQNSHKKRIKERDATITVTLMQL